MKSFGATREQIAWMRFVLEGECAASEAKFSQEYPWCLVENTRVSTNRGIIPIAQVKIGEVSESGDVVGAGVVFRNELVATITTESGRQITGTYDHPMETTDGRFVRLDESCGEVLKLRPPRFADEPYTERWGWDCGVLSELPINESYARFLGYFMGDGCYHGGIVSIVCYGKDVDVVEDVSSLMNLIFGYCGRRQTGVKKGCTEVRVTRAKFAEVMQRLGIWNSEDKPHRKVCVPECIFRSPKIIVREFLKGLFEADGFNAFHCRRVVLYSKHIEFLRDVQLLLLGFGITSRVKSRETHNKTYKYTARTLELRTEEAIRFNEQIGFISARKTARFVPSTKKHRPRNPIVMEDKVISVELAGRANVYDLTIEKNHTFSANGLVSHNTPEVAFTSTGDPAFAPAEIKYAYRTRRERPLFKGTFYRDSGTVKLREDPKGKWFIYERTIPKCYYYVGVDCARGMEFETGRATGDFSAIGIVNGTTGDAAAKFSEWVDPDMIANEVDIAGRYYNQAKVNVELTGNLGWMAQKRLRDDFLYPNFYIWKGKDDKQVGKQQSHALGWETQGRSRDILYQALRGKLRDGMKNIPGGFAPIDPELIEQMDVATLSTGGRWEVEKGHDDVLVCFMLAVVACVQYPPPMVWPSSHNVYETPKEKTDSVAASLKASPDLTHALQRDLRYVFRKERKQVRAVQGGY